jgi:DNA-binding NarL/FixJ family response regulator
LKSVSGEQLWRAIHTVYDGGAWLDPKIAGRVLKACTSAGVSGGEHKEERPVALSSRELDVLRLVVDGLTNQEIAEKLFISMETVKSHLKHIMDKLAVSDRTQAAVKAVREKLV